MQVALNNYGKLLSEIQNTIKKTEKNIVQTVNREKVLMSWQVGKIIDQHLLKNNRADYGKKLFKQLEKDTSIAKSILYQMRNFHKAYPTLPKNDLSWSHYRNLASIANDDKRKYLEDLTVENNLGSDELQRKILKLKIEEKKSAKKTLEKNSSRKEIAKLKVTRGRLFTYSLTTLSPLVERSAVLSLSKYRNHRRVPAAELRRLNSRGFDSAQPTAGGIFVDLGFNMFCEIKTTLKGGEIVESKKSGEKISLKKSSVKSAQMHTYKAYLERVVDGDTIHVILDLGFKMQHREILRLAKINASELKTAEGGKSSEALKKILKDVPFLIVKTNKTDIYGRYVADVFFSENKEETDLQKIADGGIYLSQLLLDRGLAVKY